MAGSRSMSCRCLVLLLGLLHVARSSAALDHRPPRASHSRASASLITREHVERRRAASRNLVSRGTPTGGGKYPFLAVVDWTDYDHGVHDPRDSPWIWCNGVMIAPDIVLTTIYCRPYNGYVMVGDSVNKETNQSIQFARFSGDVYRDAVVHEHGSYRVFKTDPVIFPGFVPVKLNKNRTAIHLGQNLTVVSYGPADSLVAYSYDNLTWPGQALEGSLEVTRIEDPNLWFSAGNTGAGVCIGDWAAPVLDSNRKLVALANDWSCGHRDSDFQNIAHYADFIERAACALSSYDLPFCPDLVCPADTRVIGYPFAPLPNGTRRVKGIRGFKPTRVTQWPPPGTVIGKNSPGNVTITAVDLSNRTRQCIWRVVVPPLTEIGQVALNVSVGTYNSSNSVFKQTSFAFTGSVFKMRGVVQDAISGDGANVRPKRKSGRTNGQLTIGPNETKASVIYAYPIPVDFDFTSKVLPDLSLEVEVLDNREPNNGTVTLFGQIEVYW